MSHWRDGGIGNMAGSDDRPIEEWTLVGIDYEAKVFTIAGIKYAFGLFEGLGLTCPVGTALVIAAREDGVVDLRMVVVDQPQWQPIDTAPVEPWTPELESFYRFRCLLQLEHRNELYVCEGWAYYVPPPRSRPLQLPKLRWANCVGQCFPKYWMPLPAPKVVEP